MLFLTVDAIIRNQLSLSQWSMSILPYFTPGLGRNEVITELLPDKIRPK